MEKCQASVTAGVIYEPLLDLQPRHAAPPQAHPSLGLGCLKYEFWSASIAIMQDSTAAALVRHLKIMKNTCCMLEALVVYLR